MAFRKDDRIQVTTREGAVHGYYMGRKEGRNRVLLDDGRAVLAPDAIVRPSAQPHGQRLPTKGTQVEFTSVAGATVVGTVIKPSYTATEVLDGAGSAWTIPAFKTRPSAAKIVQAVTFSKGDRVEADIKGGVQLGTVEKVSGAKVTVVLDGGRASISGPPGAFRPSNVVQEQDPPSPMDRWTVQGYKRVAGHDDSTPFQATVCLDGVPMLHASNDGWGGCNRYVAMPGSLEKLGGTHPAVRLENDAYAFWTAAGLKEAREAADLWVTWKVEMRPWNVTAKGYADDFNRSMEEMGLQAPGR
jgi:hypothetical protein